MNPFSMGRRSFVARLPLAGAAAMLPAAALAAPVETHRDKIDRLAEELTDAMIAAAKDGDLVSKQFRVVIDGDGGCYLESRAHAREVYNLYNFLHSNDHAALAEYHTLRLGAALAKSRGGRWVSTDIPGPDNNDVLLFVQHPGGKPGFMMKYREG